MALKMTDLPPQKEMQKNILYTWASSSPDDMAEGMQWYTNAYYECQQLAVKFGIEIPTVAALVSVISPSIMWGGNISAPEKLIDLWERAVPVEEWTGFNVYPANLVKAVRILNGDMSALKGLKVESFYQNIMGNVNEVTIDRWAIRVALDMPTLPNDLIVPSGKKVYNELAQAYRDVANMVEQDVPDVQAVTWTVFRNKYNGKVRKAKELAALKKEFNTPIMVK